MRRLAAVAGMSSVCVFAGCHRPSSDGAASALEASIESGRDAESDVLPARCRRTDKAFAIDDGRGLDDLEIGDAVSYPGGYAVGVVHDNAAGRVAAVALLDRDLKGGPNLKVVDLGPTLGDAPPPRIGWRSPDLVAAAYLRRGNQDEATRDVALYAIASQATNSAPLVVAQQRDDSLAFDLAFAGSAGLLVWDEATSPANGVVKASTFSKDHPSPARAISPPESDAELPRVLPQGSGFVVIWIARRSEPPNDPDASSLEATGELRARGWLEMVTVDEHGVPGASVHRLTPTSGHVSAFDVEARSSGGEPLLIVVARDDGEVVDGSGGALLRVRVKGDTVESPVAFAIDGLGRGAPTFVSSNDAPSSPFALAWIGKQEQARLLALDGSGTPISAPSAEDRMDDARPLCFLGPSAGEATGSPSFVLVATPSDEAAQLRVFACGSPR
jgi:hypothetical protein